MEELHVLTCPILSRFQIFFLLSQGAAKMVLENGDHPVEVRNIISKKLLYAARH